MAGRTFDDLDRGSSRPIVIVNQAFARRHWLGEDPLGKRLRLFGSGASLTLSPFGACLEPSSSGKHRQAFRPQDVSVEIARGHMLTSTQCSILANRKSRLARDLRVWSPCCPCRPLASHRALRSRLRIRTQRGEPVADSLRPVALLLASVGVNTTISCATTRRVREIGVRLAIGATGRDILKLVFRQETLPVVTGLIIGLAVSLAVTRLLRTQLIGVSPADPITLAGASSVLGLCAALECWMPGRRAMRVDPVVALKRE